MHHSYCSNFLLFFAFCIEVLVFVLSYHHSSSPAGDADNDAEFLSSAGLGIALQNATPVARASARRVSEFSNHQSGVAAELSGIFAEVLQRPPLETRASSSLTPLSS